MRTRAMVVAAVLVSMMAGACAMSPPTPPPTGRELVLMAYDVPAAHAAEIERVLSSAMPREGENSLPVGRVSMLPDGRLLVVAPHGIQHGVGALVAGLASRPAPPAPPTISMTYWLVIGKRSSKDAATPVELREIDAALAAAVKADGPMEFRLVEKATVASLPDEHGELQGVEFSRIAQRGTIVGGKLLAELKIDPLNYGRVETRVQIEPGQLVLLAESGATKDGDRLYYIARATVRG